MTEDDVIDEDDTNATGLGVEDDHKDHQEVEVREDDQGSPEDNVIINYDLQPRYILRSRKVNMTTINDGQLEIFHNNMKDEKKFTPILKFKNYVTAENYKLDYFKLSDRAHFRAHKKGLVHHHLNCTKVNNCSECNFHTVTKKNRYYRK